MRHRSLKPKLLSRKLTLPLSRFVDDRLPCHLASPIVRSDGDVVEVEWSLEDEGEEQYIDSFLLELKKDGYGLQQAYDGSSHCVKISDLTKGWTYHFRVRAVNSMGAGENSDWRTFVVPLSPAEDAQSPRTQDYVNKLHVAISTRNAISIEALLEQAEVFDMKNFDSLLELAMATVNSSQQSHSIPIPESYYRPPPSRIYLPTTPGSPTFSPRTPKSLL